jgi:hypothetical protein
MVSIETLDQDSQEISQHFQKSLSRQSRSRFFNLVSTSMSRPKSLNQDLSRFKMDQDLSKLSIISRFAETPMLTLNLAWGPQFVSTFGTSGDFHKFEDKF